MEDQDRETGTVKYFNEAQGYGSIIRDSGGEAYVHYRAIAGLGFRTLRQGQRVEFAVFEDKNGRITARDVIVLK